MKILILEDEPLIAEDMAGLLEKNDYEVLGICHTPNEAISVIEQGEVEMVLLDINLNSETNGIDVAKQIQKLHHLPYLFITSYADKATLAEAKQTEPVGYITKPFTESSLMSAIEIGFYNFAQRSGQGLQHLNLERINQQIKQPISEREFEVLQLIFEGNTNQQIANVLFISMNTVKKHINNMYPKLDTYSRASTLTQLRKLMSR